MCVLKIIFFLLFFFRIVDTVIRVIKTCLSLSLHRGFLYRFYEFERCKSLQSYLAGFHTPKSCRSWQGPALPVVLRTTSRCHGVASRVFVLMNCLFGGFGLFLKDFESLVGILVVPLGNSVTGQIT